MNFDPTADQGSPHPRTPKFRNLLLDKHQGCRGHPGLVKKYTGNSTSFMPFCQVYVNFTELIHRQVVRVKTWFDFYLLIVI